jgi:acetyltransferase-like isoleucine patch superfamily enzyme
MLITGKNCKIYPPITYLGNTIIIGDNVWIGQDCILDGTGTLVIEDNVIISAGTYIFTHVGHGGKIDIEKPVLIKQGAWVMSRASINPGVTIGENAIVRNCAVVTHDVPDGATVQGNPARVVV